jgi:hypothetical protein
MNIRSVCSVGAILFVALLACKQGGSDESNSDESAAAEDDGKEEEKAEPKVKPCPRNWLAAQKDIGVDGELECECDQSQVDGSVWGSQIYTSDSSICHAAAHAGAIPRTGGKVKAKGVEDCAAYEGSTANGVKTSSWGKYDKGSFYFVGHGDGKCATVGEQCPRSFNQVAGYSRDTELTCHCSSAAMTGSVWGSDIYTVDSSICAAARHAGAVGAEGGSVTVKGAYGCGAYRGSFRNGIRTARWGKYALSFYFKDHGDGICK